MLYYYNAICVQVICEYSCSKRGVYVADTLSHILAFPIRFCAQALPLLARHKGLCIMYYIPEPGNLQVREVLLYKK